MGLVNERQSSELDLEAFKTSFIDHLLNLNVDAQKEILVASEEAVRKQLSHRLDIATNELEEAKRNRDFFYSREQLKEDPNKY